MFETIQEIIVDQQDGLEAMLCQMESIDGSSTLKDLDELSKNPYLFEQANNAFSAWYLAEHYTLSYVGNRSESYYPLIENILDILKESPNRDSLVRMSVYSENEMVVRPSKDELEDYFLLTPKT